MKNEKNYTTHKPELHCLVGLLDFDDGVKQIG